MAKEIQRLRLLDKSLKTKGVARFGLPAGGWLQHWGDTYHTLLNMSRYSFLLFFVSVYLCLFLLFALLYMSQPAHCAGAPMHLPQALWLTIQTTSTSYTHKLQPDPACPSINVLVLFQVIVALLVDYCMMGLVFQRFANPNNRSITIRYSSSAVLFRRPEDGLWCLSLRLANIRRHSLIHPSVSLMLALPGGGHRFLACGFAPATGPPHPHSSATRLGGPSAQPETHASFESEDPGDDSAAACGSGNSGGGGSPGSGGGGRHGAVLDGSGGDGGGAVDGRGSSAAGTSDPGHLRFRDLEVEELASQLTHLRLGLHAHIDHVIRPGSPLFGLSLEQLQELGGEVLCILEAIDPSTAADIQAWHAYPASAIRRGECFVPMELSVRGSELGLDFRNFDATRPQDKGAFAPATAQEAGKAGGEATKVTKAAGDLEMGAGGDGGHGGGFNRTCARNGDAQDGKR